ncbi:hypothetical protein [Brevundimonas sp.]|uniref:hypothetical protein n=1 Tax=Brevundimonas sp. TaxID=1871086 RepID=UPI003D6CB581
MWGHILSLDEQEELINRVAAAEGVSAALLVHLLGLQEEFHDLNQPNARRLLQDRISDLILPEIPPLTEPPAE